MALFQVFASAMAEENLSEDGPLVSKIGAYLHGKKWGSLVAAAYQKMYPQCLHWFVVLAEMVLSAPYDRSNLIEAPRSLFHSGRTPLSRGATPSLYREKEILKVLKRRCTSPLLKPVINRLAEGHRVPNIDPNLWTELDYCMFEALVSNSYQSVVLAWAQTHFSVKELKALLSVKERWKWGYLANRNFAHFYQPFLEEISRLFLSRQSKMFGLSISDELAVIGIGDSPLAWTSLILGDLFTQYSDWHSLRSEQFLHLLAAGIRKSQHAARRGLKNVSWTPEFLSIQVGQTDAGYTSTYKILVLKGDSELFDQLDSGDMALGFEAPSTASGSSSTARLPSYLSTTLKQGELLALLKDRDPGRQLLVKALEDEWKVSNLAERSTRNLQPSSWKQVPGPFHTEWRASVSGNLEDSIRLSFQGAFVGVSQFAVHKGSVIHSFRNTIVALMQMGAFPRWRAFSVTSTLVPREDQILLRTTDEDMDLDHEEWSNPYDAAQISQGDLQMMEE